VIARWGSPDDLSEFAFNLTLYRYCFNNPVNFTDPYGLWETDKNGNQTTDKKEDIERFVSYLQAENAMNVAPNISQISSFVKEEESGGLGKLTDGSKLLTGFTMHHYSNGITGAQGWTQNLKQYNNFWHQVQGDLTPDALDPRTIGHNLMWLTYTGPWNPKKYNGQDSYDYVPKYAEDVPAYNHDEDFDKAGLVGAGAVFNATAAQTPNVRLVNAEVKLAFSLKSSPVTRVRASVVAIGIGVANVYNVFSNGAKDVFHPIAVQFFK